MRLRPCRRPQLGRPHALTYGYIKGRKFHDLNVNGVRDSGEPYLEGWTIKAYKDTDGDGVKDANETTVSDSDSTDSNGYYFLTLLAGKYVVCETQQSGWTQSASREHEVRDELGRLGAHRRRRPKAREQGLRELQEGQGLGQEVPRRGRERARG